MEESYTKYRVGKGKVTLSEKKCQGKKGGLLGRKRETTKNKKRKGNVKLGDKTLMKKGRANGKEIWRGKSYGTRKKKKYSDIRGKNLRELRWEMEGGKATRKKIEGKKLRDIGRKKVQYRT